MGLLDRLFGKKQRENIPHQPQPLSNGVSHDTDTRAELPNDLLYLIGELQGERARLNDAVKTYHLAAQQHGEIGDRSCNPTLS